MDTRKIEYDVISHLGNISEKNNYTKEANLISWSGREAIYDLRGWRIGKDGIKYPLKGISMEKTDLIALRDLLIKADLGWVNNGS